MLNKTNRTWLLAIGLCITGAVACGDDDEGDGQGTTVTVGGGGTGQGASGLGGTGQGGTGAGGTGAGGTGTGATGAGGSATLDCTLQWRSGFETGFPGEWSPYDNGSWSPDGSMPPGRVSAWTIIDNASGEPIYAGDHAYKGWIVAPAGESHRAYPGVSPDTPTPAVNTFMVYLEADYGQMSGSQWIHFGTWGNYDIDSGTGLYALHTMSMRDSKLEFAHTEPHLGEYIGPQPQPDFPTGQWVRFTMYLHYQGNTGFAQVWQDGVAMFRGDVSQLAGNPGTELLYAHWGMYANQEVSQGVQYNDEIRLWSLSAPLTDFDTEPDCYLGP